MKVLVLGLHGILGGTETYINNLVHCFDSEKIECDFLIVGNQRTPYEDVINKMYNNGRNHFFYSPDLKKEPINGYKFLKRFYTNNDYDLIYLNATSAANIIYCIHGLENKKIPLITHSHFSNGKWINHKIFRPYLNKKSVFKLACAEPAARWMYNSTEGVIFIPNGIDTSRFSFSKTDRNCVREKLGIKDDEIVIGHVGRFSPEKNHSFMIELCLALPYKFHFLCVGDGPEKNTIQEIIADKGISNRFTILPVDTSVEKYYSAMDIFIMPSLYEGLPIVSVEAQCSGLEVVFSDTISSQTNITNHCYYEKLNNVESWKNRILSCDFLRYEGDDLVRKSGFGINESAKLIEQIFNDAIS